MSEVAPEALAVTESAAPQVKVQTTEPQETTPQAETPAGDEQEATASDDDPSQDDPDKPQTWKDKRKERNRARWQEYKAAKESAGPRLASLEKEVQRLRSQQPPDFSQIADPTEELAERTAWKVEQRRANEAEGRLHQERENTQIEQVIAMQKAWDEAKADGRERMPDFDKVVTDATPIHPRMAPHLVDSDKAADIAYHLGLPANREKALELAHKFEKDPAKALIEFGKLEASFSAPKAKTVSTAPKPATRLNGGTNPLSFDPSKSSVADMQSFLKKAGVIR